MSVILRKFRIMATKQSVRGDWSGVATGVQRSRVNTIGLCPNVTGTH
jgi:hypothetical protein